MGMLVHMCKAPTGKCMIVPGTFYGAHSILIRGRRIPCLEMIAGNLETNMFYPAVSSMGLLCMPRWGYSFRRRTRRRFDLWYQVGRILRVFLTKPQRVWTATYIHSIHKTHLFMVWKHFHESKPLPRNLVAFSCFFRVSTNGSIWTVIGSILKSFSSFEICCVLF